MKKKKKKRGNLPLLRAHACAGRRRERREVGREKKGKKRNLEGERKEGEKREGKSAERERGGISSRLSSRRNFRRE